MDSGKSPDSNDRTAAYLTVNERLKRAGQIGECDPDHMAGALTGLVEGLLLQAFADPGYDPLEVWPSAWKLVERGLTDSAKRPESAG